MDPYEYLLNKFNVILKFTSVLNTQPVYIKLETCEKLIAYHIPIDWTKEQIFKYFRNLDLNNWVRQFNKELDCFCRQLSYFPDDLESKDHVDLLLTLNGMNKEA